MHKFNRIYVFFEHKIIIIQPNFYKLVLRNYLLLIAIVTYFLNLAIFHNFQFTFYILLINKYISIFLSLFFLPPIIALTILKSSITFVRNTLRIKLFNFGIIKLNPLVFVCVNIRKIMPVFSVSLVHCYPFKSVLIFLLVCFFFLWFI